MPIKKYKNSRIVNINANIVLAGALSTLLASYPVYLTKMITHSPVFVVLLSFIIDAVIDFILFSGLHAIAHRHHFDRLKPSKKVVKDVARIQTHRIFLAVLYFAVATALHYSLIMFGLGTVGSFLISYLFALGFTRTVHTIYGIKTGLFEPI